jgi:predicted ester cyclase
MTATVTNLESLANAYSEAWNAHDVDLILSMHNDESFFHLHLAGYELVSGEQNLRAHFQSFFDMWPDLEFQSERLITCEGLITNQMKICGTLAVPMPVAWGAIEPNGERVSFDAVDILRVRNAKILSKETYLDSGRLLLHHGAVG